MSVNINSVVITGNLTRDPELRSTDGGTSVCNLRVAVNGRRKNGNGDYVDKPNYFSVTIWGAHGEKCAEHLSKGRPVAIEGRLDWRERGEGDEHREYVSIVANTVQFLGSPDGSGNGASAEGAEVDGAAGGEEDIPF